MVETGPFFAKMSLKWYLVLVPREVLLPLGSPKDCVESFGHLFLLSIFGWLVRSHARTDGSVYRHSPLASRPLGHTSLVPPAVLANPKDAFSA